MRTGRLLGATLLLSGMLPAWAAPPPIELPDVRANVLKLLQEGKAQGTATVIEDEFSTYSPSRIASPGGIPSQALHENPSQDEDLFSQALEQRQQHGGGDDAVDTTSLAPEPPHSSVVSVPAKRLRNDDHVPLPSKVITIQDLQDLRQLHDEFEQAKKRQQEE